MAKPDGGPAFPRPASEDRRGGTLVEGDQAVFEQDAMTLRDYFAGQALAGMLVMWKPGDELVRAEQGAAIAAYRIADAMLAERTKAEQG